MTANGKQTAPARGAVFGLGAAALFGLSAPVAKVLLGRVSPVVLAGLLYLGAAVGLWLHRLLAPPTKEAGLTRRDFAKLGLVVLSGGVIAPEPHSHLHQHAPFSHDHQHVSDAHHRHRH